MHLKVGRNQIFFVCKWKVNIHIIISLDVFDFFLNSMLVKIGILKTVGIFRYSESKGRQLVLLLRHKMNTAAARRDSRSVNCTVVVFSSPTDLGKQCVEFVFTQRRRT